MARSAVRHEGGECRTVLKPAGGEGLCPSPEPAGFFDQTHQRKKFTPEECAQKREEMFRYCGQDTLAMVKIHEVFERMAGE